jgi:SAM-dependent methyltransferase
VTDARAPISGKAREKVDAKHVRAELLPEQSPALLKTLHLLTREGHLNADARRKLKQVNHLVGLVQPALDDVFTRFPAPVVADVGSGNAYLGFVLYELFFARREAGEVWSVESRADLVARSAERAKSLGYQRMRFAEAAIDEATLPERVHVLTALHACDTATDDAIVQAVRHKADHVALVPCCQAEVAQQLKEARGAVRPEMRALFAHPWHRREFGSHLTNVVRALLLESQGYQVTVTELAGWEHSLKNELILGRRVHKENREARARLDELLAATGVRPKAVRVLLGEAKA